MNIMNGVNKKHQINYKKSRYIYKWCKTRTEKEICAVSHSSYMGNLIFGTIGDENHQLEHCTPYRYKIDI